MSQPHAFNHAMAEGLGRHRADTHHGGNLGGAVALEQQLEHPPLARPEVHGQLLEQLGMVVADVRREGLLRQRVQRHMPRPGAPHTVREDTLALPYHPRLDLQTACIGAQGAAAVPHPEMDRRRPAGNPSLPSITHNQ